MSAKIKLTKPPLCRCCGKVPSKCHNRHLANCVQCGHAATGVYNGWKWSKPWGFECLGCDRSVWGNSRLAALRKWEKINMPEAGRKHLEEME